MTTKGISFKHVNMDSGTNLILVDTAGSYSPVKIESEAIIYFFYIISYQLLRKRLRKCFC